MVHSKDRLFAAVVFILALTAVGPLGCTADVQSGDLPSDEPTSTTKQALAPNSLAGFVLSPWPTTNGAQAVPSYWSYNSTRGTNTVRSITTGQYEVDFPGLGYWGAIGDVQVSPFGSSNERCNVANWAKQGSSNLQVFVNCFDFWGNPVNSLFTLHFFERGDVVPRGEAEQGAYVWVDKPSSNYDPSTSRQWSSKGAWIGVQHNSVGSYTVTFSDIDIENNGGIAEVTAYGTNPDGTVSNSFCKVAGWGFAQPSVNVACFNGTTHQPADSRFNLNFSNASPNDVNSYNWSFINGPSLWAQSPYNSGSIYAGLDGLGYPYGITPGLVSVARRSGGRSVGDYAVKFPGMATSSSAPLSVNVTSYGWGSDMCEVGGWWPSGNDGFATVFCYDANNNFADEDFTTTYNSFAYVIP